MADIDISEHIICCLKVLASLREGERLLSDPNGTIRKQSPGHFDWFTRWIFSQGRESNTRAVNKVFMDAYSVLDAALHKEERLREQMLDTKDTVLRRVLIERIQNAQLIESVRNELKSARLGLDKLQQTYRDDGAMVAKLSRISERVEEGLARVSASLTIMQTTSTGDSYPLEGIFKTIQISNDIIVE